jgi:hypothetical protein
MKTTPLTFILALATTGLAQQRSNVLISTEPNFDTTNGGRTDNLDIPIGSCGTSTSTSANLPTHNSPAALPY